MKTQFFFGGDQASFSFDQFHADIVNNSLVAEACPAVDAEMVVLQNDPDSSGNLVFGDERLGIVGTGIELQPGKFSSLLPVQNLNLIWHKEDDATTYLRYYLIGDNLPHAHYHLLQEDGSHILLEDGGRISLL